VRGLFSGSRPGGPEAPESGAIVAQSDTVAPRKHAGGWGSKVASPAGWRQAGAGNPPRRALATRAQAKRRAGAKGPDGFAAKAGGVADAAVGSCSGLA